MVIVAVGAQELAVTAVPGVEEAPGVAEVLGVAEPVAGYTHPWLS